LKKRDREKELREFPQLAISGLSLKKEKTITTDPRVSRFLSIYGKTQESDDNETK
jgi:hypothetical protein